MKLKLFAAILVALLFADLSRGGQLLTLNEQKKGETVAAIRAVLDAQVEAWNRGDIEGYMKGYARSEDTEFVSGDTLTRGWQTVADRYRAKYDTREKMGTLRFSDLEIEVLGPDAAFATGRWHLTRAGDAPHGRFTLILRRLPDGWRIVHDHTSAA